jgi:hypothetical protein
VDASSQPIDATNNCEGDGAGLPALLCASAPLVPERSDFIEGDAPVR